MRTYQSNEPKRKLSKKALITILTSCSVVAIALIVTLSLVLGRTGAEKPEPKPVVKPIEFVMPMADYTLGQDFSMDELVYSSTLNQWRTHRGTDFIAPKGTDVKAVADGTVTSVKATTLEGYVVTITHKDGYVTVYKSLGEEIPVEEGQQITAGTTIGVVDTTMVTEQAVGAHLHLEMTLNGALVDPMEHLPQTGEK